MNIIMKTGHFLQDIITTLVALTFLVNLVIISLVTMTLSIILFTPIVVIITLLIQLEKLEKWLTT
jgi:hypothetical protein